MNIVLYLMCAILGLLAIIGEWAFDLDGRVTSNYFIASALFAIAGALA